MSVISFSSFSGLISYVLALAYWWNGIKRHMQFKNFLYFCNKERFDFFDKCRWVAYVTAWLLRLDNLVMIIGQRVF